ALERRDQDGVHQLGKSLELEHPQPPVPTWRSVLWRLCARSVSHHAACHRGTACVSLVDLPAMSNSPELLRSTLSQRVLVADGAMGTMLQAQDPSMDDFQGHEGCNEILNVSRP